MEVSLKRDGWHCKIQRWTFGSKTPQFNSLCPFFWLTIFCLLVSPVVALRDLVKFVVIGILKALDFAIYHSVSFRESLISYVDIKVCQPLYESKMERVVSDLTDEEAFDLYFYVCYAGNIRPKSWNDDVVADDFSITKWKSWVWSNDGDAPVKKAKAPLYQLEKWTNKFGPGWQERFVELHKLAKQRRELQEQARKKAEEAKKAREERWRKFFNNVAVYTKYLVLLVAGIVGVYLLYGLSIVGLWFYENAGAFAEFFVWFFGGLFSLIVLVLLVIAGLAAVFFLCTVAFKLLKKCNLFTVKPRARDPWLVRVAKVVSSALSPVVSFFVMYFKAVKQNYCPRINWE